MESKILEAKQLLMDNDYIVIKLTEQQIKDMEECEESEYCKDCLGCSCNSCLVDINID